MNQLFWIALGGAAGAVARFIGTQAVQNLFPLNLPLGTWLVNILGCLLIGIAAAAWVNQPNFHTLLKPLIIIGFLGGFTTFSSYALELVQLTHEQQIGKAFLYLALSNILGFAAAWIGYRLFSA